MWKNLHFCKAYKRCSISHLISSVNPQASAIIQWTCDMRRQREASADVNVAAVGDGSLNKGLFQRIIALFPTWSSFINMSNGGWLPLLKHDILTESEAKMDQAEFNYGEKIQREVKRKFSLVPNLPGHFSVPFITQQNREPGSCDPRASLSPDKSHGGWFSSDRLRGVLVVRKGRTTKGVRRGKDDRSAWKHFIRHSF